MKTKITALVLCFSCNAFGQDADTLAADRSAEAQRDPYAALDARFDKYEIAGRRDSSVVVPSDVYWHGQDKNMESLYVKKEDGKWRLVARGTEMTIEQARELKRQLSHDESIERLIVDKVRKVLFVDPAVPYMSLHSEPYEGIPICTTGFGNGPEYDTNHYGCACTPSYSREKDGYSLCTSSLAENYSMLGTVLSAFFAPMTGTLVTPKKVNKSELRKVINDIGLTELLNASKNQPAVKAPEPPVAVSPIDLDVARKQAFAWVDGNAVMMRKCDEGILSNAQGACAQDDRGWNEWTGSMAAFPSVLNTSIKKSKTIQVSGKTSKSMEQEKSYSLGIDTRYYTVTFDQSYIQSGGREGSIRLELR